MKKYAILMLLVLAGFFMPRTASAGLVDNGNGTVTDTVTGLTWQQGEPGDIASWHWHNAVAYCNGLTLGGDSDWRLPSVSELESLTDDVRWSPVLDSSFFPNAFASYYWSSTTYADDPGVAWGVNFSDGHVDAYSMKYIENYVRCVRGGQSGSLGSFDHLEITYENGGAIYDKAVNDPFPIKITARNADGTVKTDFNGKVYLQTVGTINPLFVTLANGTRTENIRILTAANGTSISATGGGITGSSNLFNVTGAGGTTGKVRFKVKDNMANALSGAEVKMRSADGTTYYQCQTDSNGTCTISNVAAGWYSAWASKDSKWNDAAPVFVTANKWAEPSPFIVPMYSETDVPVILVPGMMGSTDKYDGNSVFPELFSTDYYDQAKLMLHDPRKQAGWRDLKKALEDIHLYEGSNVFECPWDWRMPLGQAVEKYLKPVIAKAKASYDDPTGKKVNIIAHSMGGLLVRTYIQGGSYDNDILNFTMVGTPNTGSTNAYYMWEGGDPLKADNLTDSGVYSVINFYWNTTKKLYEDTYNGGHLASDDYAKIRQLYLDYVPSARQLLPTYPFLRPKGASGYNRIITEGNVNVLLKWLNENENRFELMGKNNDNGKINTRVYYSSSEDTIGVLDVLASVSVSGRYADGRPKDPDLSKIGDGTVPVVSATMPYTEGWANSKIVADCAHASLIRQSVDELVKDLYPDAKAAVRSAVRASDTTVSMLGVTVRGNAQPYLVNPSGAVVGVNPATGDLENTMTGATSTLDANVGALSVENPADGTYTLSLTGESAGDYRLSINYLDSGTAVQKEVHAYKNAGSTSFTFTVSAASEEKITINKTPQPPAGLIADAFGADTLLTRLSWTPATGATGYKIYSRAIDEPILSEIGTSANATFDTAHPWARNDTVTPRLYAVTAVASDGTESFLSIMAKNDDRDHDGLTDTEEATYGTNVNNPDTDGDGLKDGEEIVYGTSPVLPDTDGDGSNDYLEVQHNGDPLDPAVKPSAIVSVTFSGSGAGNVTSNPAGIASNTHVSHEFEYGSSVTLAATRDQFSLFSGWSGACSGTADCILTLDVDKSVIATFEKNTAQQVRLNGTYYSTIMGASGAYQAAVSGNAILIWGTDFSEDFTFNLNKAVTLKGGYDSGYTTPSGYTTLTGPVTIQNGSLSVENLLIK